MAPEELADVLSLLRERAPHLTWDEARVKEVLEDFPTMPARQVAARCADTIRDYERVRNGPRTLRRFFENEAPPPRRPATPEAELYANAATDSRYTTDEKTQAAQALLDEGSTPLPRLIYDHIERKRD